MIQGDAKCMSIRKMLISITIFAVLLLLVTVSGKKDEMEESEPRSDVPTKESSNGNPVTETAKLEGFQSREKEKSEDMPPFKFMSDEFQAGMNILIYGHPDLSETKKVFKQLRSLGINSVALNFPYFQSDWQANEVFISSEYTPTNIELEQMIKIAQDYNLSVMIRPIMDEQAYISNGKWRGQIKPENPDKWFDSYQELILSYAAIAEATDAMSLNIGTELNSMQRIKQDRWAELIENVRRVYKGDLLYSFNYDTISEIPALEFVTMLDHVGIDAYFPLNLPDDASVEMLQEEWKNQLTPLEESLTEHSIIVTEVGVLPVAGAYRTPYAWSLPDRKYEPQVQANYYEATYLIWKPRTNGIYWWAVTLGEDPNSISFSPLGLPAEEVLKKFFVRDD